jgi:hypothetical protein
MLFDSYNLNPNDLAIPGPYTKNLAGLTSNTLANALTRLDQMNIPNVSTDLWTYVGGDVTSASGVNSNITMVGSADEYAALYIEYWYMATVAPSTAGVYFRFNNDATSAAYRVALLNSSATYNTTGNAASAAAATMTEGALGDYTVTAGKIGGIFMGTAKMSIRSGALRHSLATSINERASSTAFTTSYTNYSNTVTPVTSIQVFTKNGSYNGYVKIYAMK